MTAACSKKSPGELIVPGLLVGLLLAADIRQKVFSATIEFLCE